jgi:O-antigen biosynthesis protein WbqP
MKLEPLIALAILVMISPFLIFIILIIKFESKGPALFWSKRYGLSKNIFYMPKFRSMIIDTPIASTQTLKRPELYVTKFGNLIRKTSVDELPQLWSIVLGNMSFIGPRPLLSTEKKLLSQREKFKGNDIKPGITGWAQVNGRDNNSPKKKIEYEKFYVANKSFLLDVKIILKTFIILLNFKNITH